MNQPESEISRLRAALERIKPPGPIRVLSHTWRCSQCGVSAASPAVLQSVDHQAWCNVAIIRAALAIQPAPTATGPGPEWWDDNSVQCGNCGVQIITLGDSTYLKHGDIKRPNMGLSDVGDSEDEALCGLCAGAQMYIYMDELEALREKPAAKAQAGKESA